MPRILSGIRVARARRDAMATAEETDEIDFNLSLNMGIEILCVSFAVENAIPTGADPNNAQEVALSLHAETGALEDNIVEGPVDTHVTNSEILCEAVFGQIAYDNATQAAFTSGWHSAHTFPFAEWFGRGIVLATNPTFNVESTGTFNGLLCTIWYRYVQLSDAELIQAYALRR